jgi:hypothetical protein
MGVIIRTIRILGFFSILSSCSNLERSEQEKIKKKNQKIEYIYRNHSDCFAILQKPHVAARQPYPWENEITLPRVTKEYFRCKGKPTSPPFIDSSNPQKQVTIHDCEGAQRHGLPIIHSKENVYPTLIEILNYIQKKTNKRVIITCGHRCPIHNTYSDPSKENKTSKHQIGAEVDFYVQGLEEQPVEVVTLILQYYQEHAKLKNDREYTTFERYERADSKILTPPWFNKEVFIKVLQSNEGRDLDNRHPYPYISLQIRYDRDKKEKVLFNWEKASRGYPRN